jgi:hypothetical protein
MKFAAYAALMTAATINAAQVDQNKLNTEWFVDGARGFYHGYYKSFYKATEMPETMEKCLDRETVDNLYRFEQMAFDPIGTAAGFVDISKDLTLVSETSEVFFNLSNCHFETSVFDILGTCTSNPVACSIATISQNWSKNMFLLIGKMTSMAESLENFPNPDNDKFEEQTTEIGTLLGTFVRVTFDIKK